mgnify:CR=1 FL=1
MSLSSGFHPVPNGHLAAVVTYLEMTTPQLIELPSLPNGITVGRETMGLEAYRALFRRIGAPWLWSSRLAMDEAALAEILDHPQVETWIIRHDGDAIGLIELDFREAKTCELAFFGLAIEETGQGLGHSMMALAQTQAFSKPIDRLHLHTCTLDAPQALGFYQKAGFIAYKRQVEILPDPRLRGLLPSSRAGHIPCLT